MLPAHDGHIVLGDFSSVKFTKIGLNEELALFGYYLVQDIHVHNKKQSSKYRRNKRNSKTVWSYWLTIECI